MPTYGYRRSLSEATYAANRRHENRRIYAEQQVDWFYSDLLKAQKGCHLPGGPVLEPYWAQRLARAERNLAEANVRLAAMEVE